MPKELLDTHTDALKFVHITDTHLLNSADETFHNINTKQTFEAVLSQCQERYPNIDFLLFTGDISQTGTKESYALLKSIIERCDIPIYCVPGNHDTPKLLRNVIPNSPDSSINIIQIGRFSLILISSWVKNKHHGMVTQHCLQQLEDCLQNNDNQFMVIAIHHPPVFINSVWLDEIGLHNKTEFLQTINKFTQNKLLLFGHVHQEFDWKNNKLRVLTTPSTCYQYKAKSKYMHRLYTPPPAYRYVRLTTSNQIDTKVHFVK